MSTLTDAANFAYNADIRLPMQAGVVAAAVNIMAEDGSTQYHDQRVNLAIQAIRNPSSVVDAFCWAVSTNATVVDEWTADNRTQAIADFAFTISSVWNAVAGAATETVDTTTTTGTTTPTS